MASPVLREFIGWYNHGRVHQGLNGIPDPDPTIDGPKPLGGRLVAIPVLNGLHHDYRMAAQLSSNRFLILKLTAECAAQLLRSEALLEKWVNIGAHTIPE